MEVKQKIAYIVTENGCMNPQSGAYQHIAVGMRELGEYFEVVSFLPSCPPSMPVAHAKRNQDLYKTKGAFYGALRDLRDLWRVSFAAWKVSSQVRRSGCTMAYVRVQTLSPVSFFLKLRGIRTFLEANGLQCESRQKQFRSLFTFCYEPYERWLYQQATHVFFVGSYGDYWHLPVGNWSNVENGIESELFSVALVPKPQTPPLRLCLLARLMGHHQVDVLIEAIKALEPQIASLVELHLIGSGFEALIAECEHAIVVVNHGHLPRSEVSEVLRGMHVGVIPGAPEYQSQMKLFDYAANGCLVLAPRTFHLERCFGGKGICFFEVNSVSGLAMKISEIVHVPISELAIKLYNFIREDYKWEEIFNRKSKIIMERVK